MKDKILRNSLSNGISFITRALLSFIITPILIKRLGNDLFGVWALLVGLSGYFGLLDLGMRSAIVKYTSEYHAKNKYDEMNNIISTTRTLFVGMGILSWVIMILLSFLMNKIFNLNLNINVNYLQLFVIIGADMFFTFYFMIYQGVIAGIQRYDLIVRNGLIGLFLRAVLILLYIKRDGGILTLSIIFLVSNLTVYLLNVITLKSIFGALHLSFGLTKISDLKKVWRYSWKSFVINVADRIIYYSDSIIIGIFLDPEHITYYAIASSLIVYLWSLISSVAGVTIPAISAADGVGDMKDIRRMVIKGTRVILFILIPIFCCLIILGRDFIQLWIGKGYEQSYKVLVILLVSQFLTLSQYGMTLVLYGIAEHGFLANINIIIAVVNVALSILFIQLWGLVGIALASSIALCFFRLIFIPARVLRIIGMRFETLWAEAFVPSVKIGIAYAIFLILCKYQIKSISWVTFFLMLTVSLIFYISIYYWVGLNGEERRYSNTSIKKYYMKLKGIMT